MENRKPSEKPVQALPVPGQPDLGETLRLARKRKRISVEEMAGRLGVSRFTVRNWEMNHTRPDYDAIVSLCSVLEIPLQSLFPSSFDYSGPERSLIRNCRLLKPETRDFIFETVDALVMKEQAARERLLRESWRVVPLESGSAAAGLAGFGSAFPDEKPAPFFLKVNGRTARADAVVRVSGHSMEPDYGDGDYVFFEYASAGDPGEDVIAAVAGEAFVKRIAEDGTLYSVNPEYPFRYEGDGSDVRILGRVLGIIPPEDRVAREDELLLQEIFREELAAFAIVCGGEDS